MSISSAFRFPFLVGVSGTCIRVGSLEMRDGRRVEFLCRVGVDVGEEAMVICKEDGPASGPCADEDEGKRMLLR